MSASPRTIQTAPELGSMAALLAGILIAGALVAGVLAARPAAAPDQVTNVPSSFDRGWSTESASGADAQSSFDRGWSTESSGAGSTVNHGSGGRGTYIAK